MTTIKKERNTLKALGREITRLSSELDKPFRDALDLLQKCKGAIVVIGGGKAAPIGDKLTSTFRCAGARSYALSPVDAFYGEAAAVSTDDVAVVVSPGKDPDELTRIIPWLKLKKTKIIALTPSTRGALARSCDVLLGTSLPAGAEDGLVSYTSCLTALALGDLLGLAMIHDQDIDNERTGKAIADGREAIYTIEDLIATRPGNPTVAWDTIFKDALLEMTSRGLGAISILGDDGKLAGIITDGDVRRLLQKSQGSLTRIFLLNVDSVMTKTPRRVSRGKTLTEALRLMENNAITVLPVVDDEDAPVGMIHLHDLVQLGFGSNAPEKKTTKNTKKKTAKVKTKKAKPRKNSAKKK